ncbi:hypothetical protein HDU76_011324, partial [Blyttiomyces sp. JEL0837]
GSEIEQATPFFGVHGFMSQIYLHYITHTGVKTLRAPSTDKQPEYISVRSSRTRKKLVSASLQTFDEFLTDTNNETSKAFMKYHGEDSEMAPLLRLVLTNVKISESEKTSRLDQQAKGNLARSLILRIFKSFVSKHKFVFIFDDVQWLDELSLEIILSLIKFSTKECILLLSRPVKDSGSDTLKSIFNHSHVERIQLGGLDLRAIELMIVRNGGHCYDSNHSIDHFTDKKDEGLGVQRDKH